MILAGQGKLGSGGPKLGMVRQGNFNKENA